MTTSVVCPGCGNREPKQHMADGECRDCRGVEKKQIPKTRGYVSPDRVEANPEAVAHAEQRSRQRVIDNAANQGGDL